MKHSQDLNEDVAEILLSDPLRGGEPG